MFTVTSASATCRVALDLGLTLISDTTAPSPRGRSGSVRWQVPEGLLAEVPGSSWSNPESGAGRDYRVIAGPHAGRVARWYSGSAWFQPSLRWTP